MRFVDAACKEERLFHVGFALIHRDPVGEHGFVVNDTGWKMRHDIKTLGIDARSCFDHFFNRRAFDMGDIDACPCWKDFAEILDFGCGTRHHLDGIALQESFHLGRVGRGGGCVSRFFAEIKQCHHGLPDVHERLSPAFVCDQRFDALLVVFCIYACRF